MTTKAPTALAFSALISATSGVGVGGCWPDLAALVDRAGRLAVDARAAAAAAKTRRDEAAAQLVAGGRLADVGPLPQPGHEEVAQDALRRLARLAEAAAGREAPGAISALRAAVDAEVAAAVAAGRECVDVDEVARVLVDPERRGLHLPGVVAGADRRPGWPVAAAATDRVGALHRAAAVVAGVTGGAFRVYAAPPVIGLVALLGHVPDPLRIATGAALGWAPGLHDADGPVSPEVAAEDRQAATESALRAAGWRAAVGRALTARGG